ncbi:MAG: helix-turn-helix domain-containing protein [Rhodococcus sp. (in: high G+C Gram-positive bacteria)]|nr:helix-turn-helix domain-containing protein [Rhodococcus sp. (in: high G+C Gram-positive bacteria)]
MTATIEVIASEGYRAATLARVAAHAGLSSTRLISYHFAGKDDLMRAVVGSVYGHIGPFVAERVARHDDQRSKLEAFIRSVVEFISAHREPMQALMSIFVEHPFADDDAANYDDQRAFDPLEKILREGQEAGEFVDFDVFVVASIIQRSLDGLPFLLRTKSDLDPDSYADQLVALFARATARER